jgi:putative glycosyltransferase (TIGR04372 family)
MKRLPPMERVIDFAHSELRTEWMDIFLLAGCRFFIGTASGPASVPPIYGVPCGLTNWVPIGHPLWYREVVWIPKLVRSRDKGRVLTLAEIYEAGIGRQQYARHLDERGLNAVDNSADDIAALALEMLERCEGRCAYREEDETLQRSFARISNSHGGYFGGRVGRDFLRNHPELLENSAALTP